MRLINLVIILFLLTSFAVGVAVQNSSVDFNGIYNNASLQIQNITLDASSDSDFSNGLITIVEKYVHFIGVFIFEVAKLATTFGQENPQYFEASFLLSIARLIFWLIIISLLIKPVSYAVVLLILFGIWISDKFKKKKVQHNLR